MIDAYIFLSVLSKTSLVILIAWALVMAIRQQNPLWTRSIWRAAGVCTLLTFASTRLPPIWTFEAFALTSQVAIFDFATKPRIVDPTASIGASMLLVEKFDESTNLPIVPKRQPTNDSEPQPVRFSVLNETHHEQPTVSQADSKNSEIQGINWLAAGVVLWSVGALCGCFCIGMSILSGWRLRRTFVIAPDYVNQCVARTARRLHCDPIACFISSRLKSPSLVGFFRPCILIPADMIDIANSTCSVEIRASIAHELAHWRNNDPQWQLFLSVISCVLWPLPWSWRILNSHRFACEQVCDEQASWLFNDRNDYRIALARIASRILGQQTRIGFEMAGSSEILIRLRALQCLTSPWRLTGWDRFFISLFVTGFAVVGMTGIASLKQHATAFMNSTDDEQTKTPLQEQWLSGFVMDTNNEPITDARIRIGSVFESRIAFGGIVKIDVKTDADGLWRWNLSEVPSVKSLVVEHPGYLRKSIELLDKGRFETKLEAAYQLRGRVIDDANHPVGNVEVRLYDARVVSDGPLVNGPLPIGNEHHSSSDAITDEQGFFSIRGIQIPIVNVRATHPDGDAATMDNIQTDHLKKELLITLSCPRRIELKVVDRFSMPIESAMVGVVAWERSSGVVWSQLTDSEGTVSWPNAPHGEIVFMIGHVDWCTAYSVSEIKGAIKKTVTLFKPREIRGSVIDSKSKEPIQGFRVEWDYRRMSKRLADHERYPDVYGAPTRMKLPVSNERFVDGKNGDFSLTSKLAFDQLTLQIKSDGYESLTLVPFQPQDVVPERTYELIRRPNELKQVRLPSGENAGSCNFAVLPNYSEIDLDNRSYTTVNEVGERSAEKTDDLGRFQLDDPESTMNFVAWNDSGFFLGTVARVASKNEVSLISWARLIVKDSRPALEQNAAPVTVRTRSQGTNSLTTLMSNNATRTSDGLSFERLPAGPDIESTLVSTNLPFSRTLYSTLQSGENDSVTLFGECTVKGQLKITGLPESTDINSILRCTLRNISGTSVQEFHTELGKDGSFRIERIPQGSYGLSIVREEIQGRFARSKTIRIDSKVNVRVRTETEMDLGAVDLVYEDPSQIGGSRSPQKTTNEIRFEANTNVGEKAMRGKFLALSQGEQGSAGLLRVYSNTGKMQREWENSQINWALMGPGPSGVAFDSTRERIYVSTSNGISVLGFDGRLLGKITGRFGWKTAVDGQGNIWSFQSVDRMWYRKLYILSPDLERQQLIDVNARDLCFSSKDNASWLAGETVTKVSMDGKTLGQIDLPTERGTHNRIHLINPDLKFGGCWLVDWSDRLGASACRLHKVNSNATDVKTIEIGPFIPLAMAIADGEAWLSVAQFGEGKGGTFRVGQDGTIVERSTVQRSSLMTDKDNKSVWTSGEDHFLRLSAESGSIQVTESIASPKNGYPFLWTY